LKPSPTRSTPRYGVLVRFAAYTGLRQCELVALRVGRLDLLRGTVRVAEAASEVAGRLEWGGVKTHEARTVRVPRSIAEELGAHLAGRPHQPGDLVFTAPRGGPLRQSKRAPGYFKPAARAAGLPETLRFYDLRHSCASLLIARGASVKAVQRQLGHASAPITLDTYGHLSPTSWAASPTSSTRPAWSGSRPTRDPAATKASCRSPKAQVSDGIRGCRRRGSNPAPGCFVVRGCDGERPLICDADSPTLTLVPAEDQRFPMLCGPSADQRERIDGRTGQ
jgi:Phage integrase family